MYGSQWQESIIKTPYYVYGVDTVGKKIWRTNG
nr:MAG TPA: trimer Lung surfactant protein D coiled-coil trimerization [Caudoviricetes sp.]